MGRCARLRLKVIPGWEGYRWDRLPRWVFGDGSSAAGTGGADAGDGHQDDPGGRGCARDLVEHKQPGQ
jgi:hypothetical protein